MDKRKLKRGRIETLDRTALEILVKKNIGYCAVLRELGMGQGGGNTVRLRKRVLAEGIDTSHFKDYSCKKVVPYICKECGKEVFEYFGSGKFCSQSCSNGWVGKICKNKNHAKRVETITKLFVETNSEFLESLKNEDLIAQLHKSSKSIKELALSLGCNEKHVAAGINRVRERLSELGLSTRIGIHQNPIYLRRKGELFKSRKTWQGARSNIRRHAERVYSASSKKKCCYKCGYDKHYEICHIKAVSKFDDNALIQDINSIDNLIALCPNCHWEFDNGVFTIEDLSHGDPVVGANPHKVGVAGAIPARAN